MEKPGKILVIDDDPDIGNMIKMVLEYKGFTVIVLESAEQANTIMHAGIDVVLMDMFLSGENGTEICTALKKDKLIANIPLIMMSAHPDAKNVCMDAGADDFISKPFDLDDMLSKITYFTSANNSPQ